MAVKTAFSVNDQLLKVCKSALLRRNIIAFHLAGKDYFPFIRFTGQSMDLGPDEKEKEALPC